MRVANEKNKRTVWVIVAIFNGLLILLMMVDFIHKLFKIGG